MASKMKLFLLTCRHPYVGSNYDKAHGFVVAAKNTVQAQKLAAANSGDEGSDYWLDTIWSKISGIAASSKYSSPQVVIRNFVNG